MTGWQPDERACGAGLRRSTDVPRPPIGVIIDRGVLPGRIDVTVTALVIVPLFTLFGKQFGKRVQRLTREGMQLDAELGSLMNERFNVAGAMLTKLYGRPEEEAGLFTRRAARVRDIAVTVTVYGRAFAIVVGVLAAFMTALVKRAPRGGSTATGRTARSLTRRPPWRFPRLPAGRCP